MTVATRGSMTLAIDTVVYGDQLEAPILIRGWHENDAFRLSLGPPFQPDHETLLERPPPRRSWWRVESRTRRQTVLVWGQRPNHVLHLLIPDPPMPVVERAAEREALAV